MVAAFIRFRFVHHSCLLLLLVVENLLVSMCCFHDGIGGVEICYDGLAYGFFCWCRSYLFLFFFLFLFNPDAIVNQRNFTAREVARGGEVPGSGGEEGGGREVPGRAEGVNLPTFVPKSVAACTLIARFPSTLPMTSTAWPTARCASWWVLC